MEFEKKISMKNVQSHGAAIDTNDDSPITKFSSIFFPSANI
jgi:hypothetical protein